MTTKKRKRRAPGEPAIDRPKAGPGQEFREELVDAKSGHAKRLRNIASTPLMLAYYRGQLDSETRRITADDRYTCGQMFERRWSLLHASHSRDSLDPGIGGGQHGGFSDAQQDAGKEITRWRDRMGKANFRIVRAFCGEAHTMVDALRQAEIECSPQGTAYRIREALDELVCAVTGWREGMAVDKREMRP